MRRGNRKQAPDAERGDARRTAMVAKDLDLARTPSTARNFWSGA